MKIIESHSLIKCNYSSQWILLIYLFRLMGHLLNMHLLYWEGIICISLVRGDDLATGLKPIRIELRIFKKIVIILQIGVRFISGCSITSYEISYKTTTENTSVIQQVFCLETVVVSCSPTLDWVAQVND